MATKRGYVVVDVFGSHENAIDFSSFTNEWNYIWKLFILMLSLKGCLEAVF